jgi:hypothetical protein
MGCVNRADAKSPVIIFSVSVVVKLALFVNTDLSVHAAFIIVRLKFLYERHRYIFIHFSYPRSMGTWPFEFGRWHLNRGKARNFAQYEHS